MNLLFKNVLLCTSTHLKPHGIRVSNLKIEKDWKILQHEKFIVRCKLPFQVDRACITCCVPQTDGVEHVTPLDIATNVLEVKLLTHI